MGAHPRILVQSNLGCDRTDFVVDSSIPSKAALRMSPELNA